MPIAAFWTLLSGLATFQAAACPDPNSLIGDLALPRAVVRYLADDALGGRLAGSEGEQCATDYIAREFARIGLVPGGDAGSFFQRMGLASVVNPHAPPAEGRNVVGILPGADPQRRNDYVIIGAHHDHLGVGPFGSLAPDQTGSVHHGADDNASGVAALIAVAERLASGPRLASSIVFVTFSGEELGLLGSSFFVSQPPVPLDRVRAMLNMDMVGRLQGDPLIIAGTGTAAEWEDILRAARGPTGPEILVNPDGYGPSDHTSFYAADIPVLHFFTNVHEDYHRPSDTWDKVDYSGLDVVIRLVEGVARSVADRPQLLTLQRGAGQPPSAGGAEGYGAYLGSVPDFAPIDRGVLLSGVSPGSPAEAAGVRRGDIIIRFSDKEIGDLYDLTDALRASHPGDTVNVVVLREGEERSFSITLGRRQSP
jgi:hypothetical protein